MLIALTSGPDEIQLTTWRKQECFLRIQATSLSGEDPELYLPNKDTSLRVINHVSTMLYSPCQNGKVERMSRMLTREGQYRRPRESKAGRAVPSRFLRTFRQPIGPPSGAATRPAASRPGSDGSPTRSPRRT